MDSTVYSNQMGDGSVAHPVLDIVAVQLVDFQKLIESYGLVRCERH